MIKKKILFIQHTSVIGGSPLSLLSIIKSLDRKKFTPLVMFLGGTGDVIPIFRKEKIEIIRLNGIVVFSHARGAYVPWFSRKMLVNISNLFKINSSINKLKEAMIQNQCDIVHLNTSCLLVPAVAAKSLGLKVVLHIREELHNGVFGFRKYIFRKIFNDFSDTVIAISKTNSEKLRLGEKVKVIYNSVNFKHFRKDHNSKNFLKAINIPENKNIFCMLGGTVHSKGADVLLKAANIILTKYPDTYFLIAGYPLNSAYGFQTDKPFFNLKNVLRSKITGEINMHFECTKIFNENKLLADKVKFIGLIENIPHLIASSTALIWPATQSHFARPIIEAYAMNKPVIASDFESSREIVGNDETGILFEPNNHKKLSEAIIKFIENPSLADKMGIAAYEKARNMFDCDINNQKIIKCFDTWPK